MPSGTLQTHAHWCSTPRRRGFADDGSSSIAPTLAEPRSTPAASGTRLLPRVERPLDIKQCPAFSQLLPPSTLRVSPVHISRREQDGHRNCEVVQRRQGLWIHHTR